MQIPKSNPQKWRRFLAVAEGAFQDLAGGIFRKCVHGDEAFRDLVAGDIFHHVFADLVFVEGVAFFHDDVGPDDLAAEGIGLADDGTFSDAFDFVDAVFDFAGVDVFAVHDDEVFQAVDDVDVAVFVHVGEVAGVEPAVFGEDFLGFFRFVPVALHDVVAADEELADGAGDVGAVHFDGDHGFDAGDGGAAGQVLGLRGRQDADDGGGFGEAVAFLYGVLVSHEEGLRYGLRDGGASGDEGVDGLHEGGVALARKEVVHRGDHDGDGDVVFHDGIDDL